MPPLSINELIDRYHQQLIADPFDAAQFTQVADELRAQVIAKSRDSGAHLAWFGRHSLAIFDERSSAPAANVLMTLLQALQELDWLEQAEARSAGERRQAF